MWKLSTDPPPTREITSSATEGSLTHRPSHSAQPNDVTPWTAHVTLWMAAALIGVVTSISVWLFLQGFALLHTMTLVAVGGLPSPLWWLATALTPALGGLLVGAGMHVLSRPTRLAPMADVIDGVATRGGRLDLQNGAAFVVCSLVSIGFGAPVGADTPAALIGGHLGSWLALRLHWRDDFVRSLVVAGVGAGIAATYFAHFSAVFFALEVVLGGVGGSVFVIPSMIAVVASTMVTAGVGAQPPQYATPVVADTRGPTLLVYAGAAALATIAAIAYVNLLPITRAPWSRIMLPDWAKPALAGLLVGAVGIWLPDIFGTGLDQMNLVFGGAAVPLGLLILVACAKLILTPNSLAGGFAGGLIGPAVLIGSWLGAAYGDVILRLFPGVEVSPVALSMVATAAMLAATFHAPLFATMIIFESVGDLSFLVPLTISAALAYGTARLFQPGSAYTFGFRRPVQGAGRRRPWT